MASVIGIGKAKYFRFTKQRKNKPELKAYSKRNERLRMVGWDSYPDYLASDEWKRIREEKLHFCPKCAGCSGKATQVHHWSYDYEVLLGAVHDLLISLCRECHEHIEFAEGKKVSMFEANRRLLDISHRRADLKRGVNRGLAKIKAIRKRSKHLDEEKRQADRERRKLAAAAKKNAARLYRDPNKR